MYNFTEHYNNNESLVFIKMIFGRIIFFDLSIISVNFSLVLKFVRFMAFKYRKFFFIFRKGFDKYIFTNYFKILWKNNYYLVSNYIPGLISNFKVLKSNTDNFRRKKLVSNIRNFFNFVVFFENFWLINMISNEARKVKLPSIGFVSINYSPSPFNYSIVANINSFLTLFFFFKIICINIYRSFFNKSKFFVSNFKRFYNVFKFARINKCKRFKFINIKVFFKRKKKSGTRYYNNFKYNKFFKYNNKKRSGKKYINFEYKNNKKYNNNERKSTMELWNKLMEGIEQKSLR